MIFSFNFKVEPIHVYVHNEQSTEGLGPILRQLFKMEKSIMATLQQVQDALAEQKLAREASDAIADAALALLKTTDEKLDALLAAGVGATPEQLDELLASIRDGTIAITSQGAEAQAAIDAANASNPPPTP